LAGSELARRRPGLRVRELRVDHWGKRRSTSARHSQLQEIVGTQPGLPQDGVHCSLGEIAGMVRNGSSRPGPGIPPDLVTAFRLPIEYEPCASELSDDVIGTEPREPAHRYTLTGIRTSPPAESALRSAAGSSSPCST